MIALLPAIVAGYFAGPIWDDDDDAPWPWYAWLIIVLPILATVVAVTAIRSGALSEKSLLGRWVVAVERIVKDINKTVLGIIRAVTAPVIGLLRSIVSVIPGVS